MGMYNVSINRRTLLCLVFIMTWQGQVFTAGAQEAKKSEIEELRRWFAILGAPLHQPTALNY